MKYLVMKCDDEYNREPICITEDYRDYYGFGFEVYEIKGNGKIGKCIKDFDISKEQRELLVYTFIEGAKEDLENSTDIKIIEDVRLKDESLEEITNSGIFQGFVEWYLNISYKIAKDAFIRQCGCVGDMDDPNFRGDNEYYIGIKQGSYITRNY